MKILLDILVECKKIKEKVLVFSRSIPTLGKLQSPLLLSFCVRFHDFATNVTFVCAIIDFVEHLLETMGSFRYLRMDGQTAVSVCEKDLRYKSHGANMMH